MSDDLTSPYAMASMTVHGMGGDDHLMGGAGEAYLDGGAGNDTLTSGTGVGQTLVGGPGDDDFHSTKEEDTAVPRIECGQGRDDLFIDWRPGRFSLDTASCPPFLLDRFDPPPLRVKRDRTVRVPVTFSEPVRGRVRILGDRGVLGSSPVARYSTTATLRLRLSPAGYRSVRQRGKRGLRVLVAAALVDRSGERASTARDDDGNRIGGYRVLLRG